MQMRKHGFTLLELIVVIIIIAILATLGFMQYVTVIEKGRKAEARANLGTLRTLEEAYRNDYPVSAGAFGSLDQLASGLPSACATTHYFSYSCDSGSGTCTATRCQAGGKAPNVAVADAYTMTLDMTGAFGGTGKWQ